MQNMEIERKYTLKRLPDNLEAYPCKVLQQAYLNISPVVRIRKSADWSKDQSNDHYSLTYKGDGMMVREEYNLPLDQASYQHLLEKADGNIISKRRYVIALDQPQFRADFTPPKDLALCIELDVFDAPFAPLIMAEIEFPSVEAADAFLPPDWFDEDVTLNPAYHNSAMSRKKF